MIDTVNRAEATRSLRLIASLMRQIRITTAFWTGKLSLCPLLLTLTLPPSSEEFQSAVGNGVINVADPYLRHD